MEFQILLVISNRIGNLSAGIKDYSTEKLTRHQQCFTTVFSKISCGTVFRFNLRLCEIFWSFFCSVNNFLLLQQRKHCMVRRDLVNCGQSLYSPKAAVEDRPVQKSHKLVIIRKLVLQALHEHAAYYVNGNFILRLITKGS